METGVVVASALVKSLFGKLSSSVLKEFSLFLGVKKDLKALEKTISTVKAVLEDAGKCYITDSQDYKWLRELKENIYDVDDLLDRLSLEAKGRKSESRGKKSRVIINFLKERKLVKRFKLAHEIRSIKRNLDAIATDREKFHLKIKSVMHRDISIEKPVSWSTVDEDEIYGREGDKEEIMKQLMQTTDLKKCSIIAIVGMGGLGKTTLARLAYNNIEHELKGYLKMWVDVSQSFDLDRIVRSMIECVTNKSCDYRYLESLHQHLKSEIKGQNIFLVLDDVWSDKYEDWENLKSVLQNGASGNKIIVTTRSMRVVSMMEAAFGISTFKINLEVLSEDCSTNLFNKKAFSEYESRVDSRVRGIANEIIKKCGGVPLALNILGSIMRSKDSIEEWEAVRDSAIWALGEDGDQVMNSLKLSYMNLSPCLKECFLYCSIFPNGKAIYKLELIDQWMAHGLVSSEDEGKEYFKQLVQMSFFQNIDEQENGEVTYKMHDLIYDLARSINREFLVVNNDKNISSNINIGCRYLSSECLSIIAASNIEKVRGLHIDYVDDNLIPKAKCLRSLVLDWVNNRLNFFSQELIHLRHICISDFQDEEIPIDFCALWSLQSFHLKECSNLRKLPESIGSAVGLRTLKLNCASLESLPESIGQCRSLQNLIVQSKQLESIPKSVCQLENIRLMILAECNKLERLPHDVFENCTSIRRINFYKCVNLVEIPVSMGSLANLENLNLAGCTSLESFPDEIFEKCTFIKSVNLYDCKNLKEIPASIGSLVNLGSLNLSNCISLKSLPDSIGDLQNLHSIDLSSSGIIVLPSSIYKLVNLDALIVSYCRKLKELPGSLGEIKKLRFLDMEMTEMDGIPIGIGKLTDLRRLSCFVVAKESKYARISELEHLNLLRGSLKISGLAKVSDPREVVQANLKHKKDLETLWLLWGINNALDRDRDVAILEALQPPSGIKGLVLMGYRGSEYSRWMMLQNKSMSSFQYLTSLSLYGLEKCTHLPSLVELPSLRSLTLHSMDSLKSFTGYCQGLFRLRLVSMENLEELQTIRLVPCEEHEINNTYESAFPNLSTLEINYCPKLRIKPHLPQSLERLRLHKSNEELLTGAVFSGGEAFSQISLPSVGLEWLSISGMQLLPECQFESCLPIGMRHLTSLLELMIEKCKGLNSLPEWFGELKSLQRLTIYETPLTCLPQSMQQLTALKSLEICRCPELEKRCEREIGEDWHLISHIPDVYIWPGY